MRIAVSVWEDKISPVFDTASKLLIIENEPQRETSCFEVYLLEQDIQQRCSFVRGLDLDVLICGAISRQLAGRLQASGIKIISIGMPLVDWISYVIEASLSKDNSKFS